MGVSMTHIFRLVFFAIKILANRWFTPIEIISSKDKINIKSVEVNFMSGLTRSVQKVVEPVFHLYQL